MTSRSFFKKLKRTVWVCAVFAFLVLVVQEASPVLSGAETMEEKKEKEDFDFANGLLSRGMYDMAASSYGDFLTKHPGSKYEEEAKYRKAESYFLKKDNEKALEEFGVFLKETEVLSLAADAKLRIGQIYFAEGKMEDAEEALQKTLQSPGLSEETAGAAEYYIADILRKTGKREDAKKALETMIREHKNGVHAGFARLNLGDMYLEEKKFGQAAETYAGVAESRAGKDLKTEASFREAEALYFDGKIGLAAEKYRTVIDSDAGADLTDRAALGIVSIYYNSGDSASAIAKATELLPKVERGEAKCRIMLLLGNSYLNSKLFLEAKDAYEKISEGCSSPLVKNRAMLNNCWVLYNLGEYEECLKDTGEYLKDVLSEDIGEALYVRGKALASSGMLDNAITEYEKILKEYPDSLFRRETLYDKGWAYYQKGDVDSGTEVHRMFLREFPEDERSPGILLKIGQEALKGGKYNEAIELYAAFLENYPKTPQRQFAMYQRARAFYEAGRYQEAIDEYKAILEDFPYSEITGNVFYWRALCYQKKEDWVNAVKDFREAANKGGELTVKASEAVAYSLFRQGEEAAAAEAYYAVISESIGVHAGIKKDIYVWTADFYTSRKESGKALDVLRSMGKSYPGRVDKDVMYLFGENYRVEGNNEDAMRYFSMAIENGISSPGKERCYLGMGRVFSKNGDDEKALEAFEKALAGDRDNVTGAMARGEIGDIYARENNYEEAARQYSMVAILYDDEEITPKALLRAATYFTKAGKTDEADKLLDELRTKYPRSPEAQKSTETIVGTGEPETV